ncbi:MAG: abc-2 type transporter [Chthoniobacteraceae bacterium]|nr:abc-2 type transporter [Chthoniobacteraceae bacterium]
MLALRDLSLQVGNAPDEQLLLAELNVQFPTKHFVAILGPSGCGKSTLLKVIAGVRESSAGQIRWKGRDLAEEGDFDPHEIGYVPQFSIAFDLLTVWESVRAAFDLRVSGLDAEAGEERINRILREVGIEEIADRRVQLLSGGQKRRLALALELISAPRLLLCDEVTSGLDPKAEDEIVQLMHEISREDNRIVLSVTHSLRHLALYDSVLVLTEGRLAYHGSPRSLLHYFHVEHPDELYPRLAMRDAEEWHHSWQKYRSAYYEEFAGEPPDLAAANDAPGPEETAANAPLIHTPGVLAQFIVLFARRWRLFFRDRGQLLLQLALMLGFPCLVIIFALNGIPQIKVPTDGGGNVLDQIRSHLSYNTELLHAGSLVSGLIMFQVVLLSLMGSNNAAREIAGERLILEKEKFAGLRPLAYVASKAAFLGILVVAQSVWMAVFVNMIVRFPGSLPTQIVLLTLVNAALTSICLAISSIMKSAEQASLVSVYLVGFQLPLSGAVLALPAGLNWITQPFIASYWGWSGFLQTLRDTRLYDAVQLVTQTQLASAPLAIWVLLTHILLGLFIAYTGAKSSRWD